MRALAKPYSVAEEIANSLSHGAGVIFGIIALVMMIVRSVQLDDTLRLISFTIYGVSMILLFLASTLYHAIPYSGTKRMLKTLDHCAIYLLIAGTYTPIMLLTISDRAGAIVLALVWSLAVAGIVFKIFSCTASIIFRWSPTWGWAGWGCLWGSSCCTICRPWGWG